MPRLFVALDLPEDVRDRIEDLGLPLPGARWVPFDQLHLTLAFLGAVDGGLARDVEEALATVRGEPLRLELRGVGHFPLRGHPRVAWVGVVPSRGLDQLQRSVLRALESAGCEIERRKFHPHVTVARLSDVDGRDFADWLAARSTFRVDAFDVTELVLYSSILGSDGASHSVEASWTL
jgi:2'-5' RNA ligase